MMAKNSEDTNLPKIVADEKNDSLTNSFDSFSTLSLRRVEFETDKDETAFLKKVETLVRQSPEYKDWVRFITYTLGNTKCCITFEEMNETNVHVHHHPISLFTICKAVMNKYMDDGKQFCSFDIAQEVISLHYKNKIGYMTLLGDIHKKYHNGFQQLPIESVHGDYKEFIEKYPINDDDLERINELENIKLENLKVCWSKDNYPIAQLQNNENKKQIME